MTESFNQEISASLAENTLFKHNLLQQSLVPSHQMLWQGYFLRFTTFSRNEIILSQTLIKLLNESFPDSGCIFINGILGRVSYIHNTLLHPFLVVKPT